MISREELLEAAIRVFAKSGFRGATTRRIADEAGVNEVTLFRRFRSKTALINEAAQLHARRRARLALPVDPADPLAELTAWCSSQLAFLRNSRGLIRKCMAELEEHPEMADCMRQGPDVSHAQLREYADSLVAANGLPLTSDEVRVACMMLQGALFSDAMGRDMMPDLYPRPLRRAGERYARSFLRMLGIETPDERPMPGATTTSGTSRPRTTRSRRSR